LEDLSKSKNGTNLPSKKGKNSDKIPEKSKNPENKIPKTNRSSEIIPPTRSPRKIDTKPHENKNDSEPEKSRKGQKIPLTPPESPKKSRGLKSPENSQNSKKNDTKKHPKQEDKSEPLIDSPKKNNNVLVEISPNSPRYSKKRKESTDGDYLPQHKKRKFENLPVASPENSKSGKIPLQKLPRRLQLVGDENSWTLKRTAVADTLPPYTPIARRLRTKKNLN